MTELLSKLQGQILSQQVRLYACCARLQAQTDNEALHDLRIALRKLRSLLRPLRRQALCAQLEQAAAALGELSGPLRDLEVLAGELQRLDHADLARQRRMQLAAGYARLLDSLALQRLFILLDDWPDNCREALRKGEWQVGRKRVRKYLAKQVRQLATALRDPAHDRHRLRLLIKRLRYCAEAYPRHSDLSASALSGLRQAQGALGDWHDHLQWLARLPSEPDLQPCTALWQLQLDEAEQQADQALQALCKHFPEETE
ncbi:CHAD domain-containing protein [Aquipseudomonas guryensis]|uniref:CHAD domain-containing protein n=1 Tax=Aquipseudomonas guryensis TaxID=2759165 RepID=A0A7W4H3S9_9GAMM|nr:CHAD domain-containing protein [Pseudomonas guryensis]MBB1519774.1 CHAD domain-containing protein [Pseudomonas guryensis]